MKTTVFPIACLAFATVAPCAADQFFNVKNPLDIPRTAVTVELAASEVLVTGDMRDVRVSDEDGKEILAQAVDTDGDAYRKPDLLIFQTDLGPNETKKFRVAEGERHVYQHDDFKAYGRFNSERFDDFAWENDRIAQRTYGHALETWMGEPLTSSAIDIWCKRTARMVINDWYMVDDYHTDHGEGADLYSAGVTRGCGGSGIWSGGKLWTSRNFVSSKVLANGPIRVLFELTYAPFEVDGMSVCEVKTISLDAGSQLNHIVSTYKQYTKPGEERELTAGIGLKKVKNEKVSANDELGCIWKWEPVSEEDGFQGLAVVLPVGTFDGKEEDALNHLALTPVSKEGVVEYWSGFAWDKAGHIADDDAWEKYVADYVAAINSPIQVTWANETNGE